jgi:UDP-N-acetyl-D-galactosamine dehydrogenase
MRTFLLSPSLPPVDDHKVPNLRPLEGASTFIGKALKKGDYVVYESTVYPGCTEEDCLPILEQLSGLKMGTDFKLGYSPERINPGDKNNTIEKITKIVSGNDADALDQIAKTYELIIEAGVYRAESIKVAEAAKVVENTQRDLNISFMNELSIIFSKMGIRTQDVINAAATKWNFIKLSPGLVGGHCIGVDPYYLTYKAMQLGYDPQVILSGRRINDGMPHYIAQKTVQKIIKANKDPATRAYWYWALPSKKM